MPHFYTWVRRAFLTVSGCNSLGLSLRGAVRCGVVCGVHGVALEAPFRANQAYSQTQQMQCSDFA